MVTITQFGEGTCLWCQKQKEGVEVVSEDRSFTGFLCLPDLKRMLRLKSAAASSDPRETAKS